MAEGPKGDDEPRRLSREAAIELYRRHYPELVRRASRDVGERDAHDLATDALVTAMEEFRFVKGWNGKENSFRNRLYRTNYVRACSKLRARRAEVPVEPASMDAEESMPGPEDAAVQDADFLLFIDDVHRRIDAIGRLKPITRARMHALIDRGEAIGLELAASSRGMKQRWADELGCTPQEIAQAKERLREPVHQALANQGGGRS